MNVHITVYKWLIAVLIVWIWVFATNSIATSLTSTLLIILFYYISYLLSNSILIPFALPPQPPAPISIELGGTFLSTMHLLNPQYSHSNKLPSQPFKMFGQQDTHSNKTASTAFNLHPTPAVPLPRDPARKGSSVRALGQYAESKSYVFRSVSNMAATTTDENSNPAASTAGLIANGEGSNVNNVSSVGANVAVGVN